MSFQSVAMVTVRAYLTGHRRCYGSTSARSSLLSRPAGVLLGAALAPFIEFPVEVARPAWLPLLTSSQSVHRSQSHRRRFLAISNRASLGSTASALVGRVIRIVLQKPLGGQVPLIRLRARTGPGECQATKQSL